MKSEFSRQIFEKVPSIKFHQSLSSESRIVPCGQTDRQTEGQTNGWADRHDEDNSRFSQFFESA